MYAKIVNNQGSHGCQFHFDFAAFPIELRIGVKGRAQLAQDVPANLGVLDGNLVESDEIVENGANGYLVPPGDVEALSNAIADLAKSAKRRRRFGERSRKIFEEKFSKSEMVKEVQSFYKRLLKNQVNPYERDLEIGATMENDLSNGLIPSSQLGD